MESEQSFNSPPLCAKGCGFFGSAENNNMCSKCYRDFIKQEIQSNSAVKIGAAAPPAAVCPFDSILFDANKPSLLETPGSSELPVMKEKKRCESCNKRVRLMGYECRCGHVFCQEHRYPEKHSCEFDYKTMQREGLAKMNPLVKGDKLENRF